MSDDISIQFICRKNTDGKRKWASGHKTAYIISQQAWEVKHKWRPGVQKKNHQELSYSNYSEFNCTLHKYCQEPLGKSAHLYLSFVTCYL